MSMGIMKKLKKRGNTMPKDKTVIYQRLIDYFGGISPTARAIGTSKSTVAGWVGYGQKKIVKTEMSVASAVTAESITEGHFKADELCDEVMSVIKMVSIRRKPSEIFESYDLNEWAKNNGYKKGK